jgi:Helix-hairpin-helix motif
MRNIFIILSFFVYIPAVTAQEKEKINTVAEQQLENLTEKGDAETEDDSYLQQLNYFKKHPLNINETDMDELEELKILTDLQIRFFLDYRRLLGKLINVYELQAIPGWDPGTIQKLLPFITVRDDKTIIENLRDRWKAGGHVFLERYSRVLEKSKGYDVPKQGSSNYYAGDRNKLFFRYNYNYKNLLQWGLLGDKDAGEQFFKGAQKQGFDFYSFYFFARKMGIIKALAIGDFTVNFGQGLIQWQSLAFQKSADAIALKRQATSLRPYNSPGEYNFHRGAGITLQKRNWETTLFASFRKISANTVIDSVYNEEAVSSFQAGGYHRTPSENDDRNSLLQIALGGNIKYQANSWHVSINTIHYNFSKPVQKSGDPYNLFALNGSMLANTSIDYSYSYHNLHLFGEAALDNHLNKAILNGVIISPGEKVDISLLYRKISPAYLSLNGDAFTENTFPVNESGLYAGISIRPDNLIRLDAYTDVFRFPWLKYRVDAPSAGRDYLIQVTYTPNKQVEIYARYKNEAKQINRTANDLPASTVDLVPAQNSRLQASIVINNEITLRNRVELLWHDKKGPEAGQGYLTYIDCFYNPLSRNWAGNIRLHYFETSDFNSRVYAYETDLPYSFSIPFYYNKGFRYYLNLKWDAKKLLKKFAKSRVTMDFWLKWAQTIYSNTISVGSGLDEIPGNRKSEIKFQLIMTL